MIKGSYLEIDIESFIWDNIQQGTLSERGIELNLGIVLRQLDLPGCGIMDLCSFLVYGGTSEGRKIRGISVMVIELKRGVISCNDVGQISRYKAGIIECRREISDALGLPRVYYPHVSGVLIGYGIDRDAACLAAESCTEVYTFDVCWKNGLIFKKNNFDHNGMSPDSGNIIKRLSGYSFSDAVRLSANAQNAQDSLHSI